MAATVVVQQATSIGPTYTTVTAFRFRNAQTTVDDTSDAILIPGSGTSYSYEVKLRLNATVAPVTGINNIKFYTDGANGLGTGVSVYAGTQASASYTEPVNTDSTVATTDAFTYTSGAPLSVTGSIGATTGNFGDFVVLQADIAPTATTASNANSETFTFRWDES